MRTARGRTGQTEVQQPQPLQASANTSGPARPARRIARAPTGQASMHRLHSDDCQAKHVIRSTTARPILIWSLRQGASAPDGQTTLHGTSTHMRHGSTVGTRTGVADAWAPGPPSSRMAW